MLQRGVAAVKEELVHNATHPSLNLFMKDMLPRIEKTARSVKEATTLFRRVRCKKGERLLTFEQACSKDGGIKKM